MTTKDYALLTEVKNKLQELIEQYNYKGDTELLRELIEQYNYKGDTELQGSDNKLVAELVCYLATAEVQS